MPKVVYRLFGASVLFLGGLIVLAVYELPNDFSFGTKTNRLTPVYRDKDFKTLEMTNSTIPRIIHQTWKTDMIPGNFGGYAKTWLQKNPEWEYWFWTDADADFLVKKHFPKHYDLYRGYPSDIMRADAMRYFLLYKYGGFYADLDMVDLRPLEQFVRQHNCIIAQEPRLHATLLWDKDRLASNAFMASRPNHPFFELVIKALPLHRNEIRHAPVDTTGPLFLDQIIDTYTSQHQYSTIDPKNAVYLADPEVFMPSFDSRNLMGWLSKLCTKGRKRLTKMQKLACKDLYRGRFRRTSSYTDHNWAHTHGGSMHKEILTTPEKISFFVPEVKMARDFLRG